MHVDVGTLYIIPGISYVTSFFFPLIFLLFWLGDFHYSIFYITTFMCSSLSFIQLLIVSKMFFLISEMVLSISDCVFVVYSFFVKIICVYITTLS